jgi:hypothetical protein
VERPYIHKVALVGYIGGVWKNFASSKIDCLFYTGPTCTYVYSMISLLIVVIIRGGKYVMCIER